ncbi:hypothetical protein R5R35_002044 [Gryllus longicercus]|uniref:UBX domain-containing protein 1 n=1 Tax=Gryllus longicercus TaxID=2509291 RepID=A0AAN9V4X3_9ORTH
MSSPELKTLMDMGFERKRAERALAVTGNQGVEPAMEWLLAHSDEPLPNDQAPTSEVIDPVVENVNEMDLDRNAEAQPDTSEKKPGEQSGSGEEPQTETSEEAKSFKCDECGKLFKSQPEMEFHAAKSQHNSFSESTEEKKPLTEEEKREQLRKLEEKMRAKRLEREEKEKKDALEREKLRIRSGKEMVAAKKKLEEQEMKKLVEQRKREKLEEKLARQRVKEQIEQDKIARKEKFGTTSPLSPPSVPLPAQEHNERPVPPSSKEYTHTRLQIRLTNGQALTQTFGAKEQLSAVRLYVEMNRTDGEGHFLLMTNFPKKIFSEEDYEKPLDVLGLVPSAVVIVSKINPVNYHI